jgi:endonuclease-3
LTDLADVLSRLQRFYGALPAPPSDPFILFVWEVLNVHSTPRKRDAALAALKRARALTPDAMWRAPQKVLEESVALAGPYLEQRLERLRSGVEIFRRTPALASAIRGELIAARRVLKPLPVLGDGGAHRMLLFAGGHAVLPVDARVSRVARRLGYGTGGGDFKKIARSVQAAIVHELAASPESYRRAYLYLSHHGASTCAETDPHCAVCPVRADCPEGARRLAAAGLTQ